MVQIGQEVRLRNACRVFLPRAEVKEAMLYHHMSGLKEQMKARQKLDRISNEDCRKMQSYMLMKSLEDSRLAGVPVEDRHAGLQGLDAGQVRGAEGLPALP